MFTEISNFQVKYRLRGEEFFLQPGQVLPLGLPAAEFGIRYEIIIRTALRVENRFLVCTKTKKSKLSQHPPLTEVDDVSELQYPGGIRYVTPSLSAGLVCKRKDFLYSTMRTKSFADFTTSFCYKQGTPFELVACASRIPDGSSVISGFNVVTNKIGSYYAVPLPIVLSEPIQVWLSDVELDLMQKAVLSYVSMQGIEELGLMYKPITNIHTDLSSAVVGINFYDKKRDVKSPPLQPVMDHDALYRFRLFNMGRFNPDLL